MDSLRAIGLDPAVREVEVGVAFELPTLIPYQLLERMARRVDMFQSPDLGAYGGEAFSQTDLQTI